MLLENGNVIAWINKLWVMDRRPLIRTYVYTQSYKKYKVDTCHVEKRLIKSSEHQSTGYQPATNQSSSARWKHTQWAHLVLSELALQTLPPEFQQHSVICHLTLACSTLTTRWVPMWFRKGHPCSSSLALRTPLTDCTSQRTERFGQPTSKWLANQCSRWLADTLLD
jgi:hypothetical protein